MARPGFHRFIHHPASWAFLAHLAILAACAHQPVKPVVPGNAGAVLQSASWKDLGKIEDDLEFEGFSQACRASISYYRKIPSSAPFQFLDEKITAGEMVRGLERLLAVSEGKGLTAAEKMRRIQKSCLLYRSTGSDGAGAVLFTGYYEPWLEGSRVRDARFKVPVYHRPEDMLTVDLSLFPAAKSQAKLVGRDKEGQVVPYFSRGEITAGALDGKGLELLWLEDPVDLFFLQVQGSGRVTLEDGAQVRVQYDSQNGLPYRSLGKVLIDKGVLPADQVSMQAIRKYFQEHPDQLPLLNENASYTFFRLEDDGPFGNIGVALTPGRSIATDAKIFPKGAPALVRTRKPVLNARGDVTGWAPFARLVFNQDTGGAIAGPGRVDLFWGGGPQAEAAAGRMKEPGELYFLLPHVETK